MQELKSYNKSKAFKTKIIKNTPPYENDMYIININFNNKCK